jgi:hypothetical protein
VLLLLFGCSLSPQPPSPLTTSLIPPNIIPHQKSSLQRLCTKNDRFFLGHCKHPKFCKTQHHNITFSNTEKRVFVAFTKIALNHESNSKGLWELWKMWRESHNPN